MQHVAEGVLHAYLDGGLDAYASSEASQVREHLEGCERCRGRLEAERVLRERANDLLAEAGPDRPLDVPPFEELRRRALAGGAEAPVPRSGVGRRAGIRVAATVVLAVGLGWLLGRQGVEPAPEEAARTPAPAEASVQSSAMGAGSRQVEASAEGPPDVTTRPEALAATRPEPTPSAETEVAATVPASGEASAPSEERVTAEIPEVAPRDVRQTLPSLGEGRDAAPLSGRLVTDPIATRPPVTTRRARGLLSGTPDSLGAAAARVAVVRRGAAGDPDTNPTGRSDVSTVGGGLTPPVPVVSSASQAADPLRRSSGETGETGETGVSKVDADLSAPEQERRRSGRRMIVPGLDVVSVEWTEVAPDVEGLRVVQRLVNGETLEMRFGGMDGETEVPEYLRNESLPEGVRQVVVPFEEGWLVARAPLDEEQIRALIALIT